MYGVGRRTKVEGDCEQCIHLTLLVQHTGTNTTRYGRMTKRVHQSYRALSYGISSRACISRSVSLPFFVFCCVSGHAVTDWRRALLTQQRRLGPASLRISLFRQFARLQFFMARAESAESPARAAVGAPPVCVVALRSVLGYVVFRMRQS
jgi:hypothetical protein